ncbi:DUF4232 domain-containing protein [Streptomyces sp. NPDC057694]|uniref:DUF4232 domain-containing protein n=1 Tax=Streptomyces sp. NPDC057694 TaxID=3346216 RepID=UPI003679EA1A
MRIRRASHMAAGLVLAAAASATVLAGPAMAAGHNASAVSRPCTAADTKVTVSKVASPVNHLLVTATNTSGKTCLAYYAPALQFNDAQAPTPVLEDSQPQAVATLAPGQSAYAGVKTSDASGEGGHGFTATTVGVSFYDRNNVGIGYPTRLNLPGKGVYIDDTSFVTYWMTSPDYALTW